MEIKKGLPRPLVGLLIILMMVLASMCANAQSFTKRGNVLVATSSRTTTSQSVKTGYVWEEGGKQYPIYLSKNGKAYILKISKKTGKEYKKYLGVEVEKSIKK